MDNTIASISTSIGGAIAIVRVSGKKTIEIVNKIFSKDLTKFNSHTINYGYIVSENEIIDEVLVSVMLAPNTYTCEDLIEINCHGGQRTTNKILEILINNGCSLAEPGEFTKRAFLNGRIDLTKAEAVNDLINSSSESARKMNLNAVNGKLYEKINILRDKIVKILANIEVNIDYPEYTDELKYTEEMMDEFLEELRNKLEKVIEDSKNARIIKEGIKIAIIGKPNVGKSSLLNAFLGHDKAIVTNIPGTTRDIVEGDITLNDIKINFIDTAGIRETNDIVEKIGVEKSKKIKKEVDLIILVHSYENEFDDEIKDIILNIDKEKLIIYINKNDLKNTVNINYKYIEGNTISSDGIDKLKQEIINKLNLTDIINNDMTYLGNTRQLELMIKTNKSVNNAINAKKIGMSVDLIAIDLKEAWEYLGQITGEYYEDELVDNIFKNFCLGK